MDERVLQIVLRARDEASKVLRGVENSTNNLSDVFKNNYKEAGLMAGAVVGSLALMTKSAVANAASYEQNRIAFESMLGSADRARRLLEQVSDFARRTPFELPQVVEGTRRLIAYGVAQKEVIPTFQMLGDITAGVGTEKLPQLILAFGQVRAATKLTGTELRQFSETGVPLLDTLAKQFNTTAGAVQDMITNGEVSFDDVQQALRTLTSEGGLFFQGMQRQASSFNGIMSNVNDSFGRFVRQVAGISEQGDIREGSIFYYVRLGAEKLLPILDQIGPPLASIIDKLLSNREVVVAIAGAIGGLLIAALVALIATFGTAIAIAAAFAAVGAALALKVAELIRLFNELAPRVAAVMEAVRTFFTNAADAIVAKVNAIRDGFKRSLDALVPMVRDALGAIALEILKFNPIIRIGLELPDLIGKFNDLRSSARKNGIPGFAEGTDFAPGGLAMVGERGPELVNLPRGSQVLSNRETQGVMGSGPLIRIDQMVVQDRTDIDSLAHRLAFAYKTRGSL